MTNAKGLGALVREARVRRGWTQAQLADRVHVANSYLSQIETGARKWPQDLIDPLSQVLGLSQVDMAVAAGLIEAPPKPAAVAGRIERDASDPRERLIARIRETAITEDQAALIAALLNQFEANERKRKEGRG